MRLTITPLGASGQSAGRVARRIVEYLHGKQTSPGRSVLNPAPGPTCSDAVAYFSDSMEGAGMWLGEGAAALNLEGEVNPTDLEAILAGRDPATGLRLVGAAGSSQRKQLRAGTAARYGRDGVALFTVADTAVLLGVTKATVASMISLGDNLTPDDDPDVANWLRARTVGGERLIPRTEIDRWLDLTGSGVTAAAVTASGRSNDELSTVEAAAILGVTPQYIGRVCARYLDNPNTFPARETASEVGREGPRENSGAESAAAAGDTGVPGGAVAWLRCRKDGDRIRITRRDLADFASRRKPATARVGFDLTLTTEKSFGIAMMLSDPSMRTVFEKALDDANSEAIGFLETEATFTRRKGERVKGGGLIVASFLHGTSRALDPFPHRHNVIANATVDANGDRKTLDARAFYELAPAAAALATARMRHQLTRDLGVRWRRSPRGVWEIDGITDQVINEFSQRRNTIDLAAEELAHILGRPVTKAEERQIAVETRTAKVPTNASELVASWRQRAAAHGLTHTALDIALHGTNTPTQRKDELDGWIVGWLAGPDGITANLNWFTRPDVIVALVDLELPGRFGGGPLLLPPEQILGITDVFLDSLGVVPLQLPTSERMAGSDQTAYSTVDLLTTQQNIRDRYLNGIDETAGVVDPHLIDTALDTAGDGVGDVQLSADQAALVRQFCGSGMRHQAAIGPPGSGKTAAMAAAARAWETAGYRVIGAAVKGEAARLLGDAAGIETNTLAWYLTRANNNDSPFDPNTVLIVDEASTVADRDLDQLMEHIEHAGAALRLVGDPAQHGAVGAGGSFTSLTRLDTTRTPQLTGNRRLRHGSERHAANLVRNGRIDDALTVMTANGQLDIANTERSAYLAVLHRWWQARETGDPHPMVDRLNHTRANLNHLAQTLRLHAGELDPTQHLTIGETRLHVGDTVIAKHPARHLHPADSPDRYLRNGTTGIVTAITDQHLHLEADSLGVITIPVDELDRTGGRPLLDLAYAVTSYAVQGATYQQSTSILTPASSQAELYVNITRGRDHNHMIAVTPPEPDPNEPHLPRLPPPPLLAAIEHGVKRRRGETAVIDLDPQALQRARYQITLEPPEPVGPAQPTLEADRPGGEPFPEAEPIGPARNGRTNVDQPDLHPTPAPPEPAPCDSPAVRPRRSPGLGF